jgi:hypothetical protein
VTATPEPIRRSSLPAIPPPEWEFHTWYPTPDGGGDMVPGQHDRGIQVRRRVTYGDWEPVQPDRWADEPTADATTAEPECGWRLGLCAGCPQCVPEPGFGVAGCTCRPWTRQTDPPRYLDQPGDTVDMIGGRERGNCPHHGRPAKRGEATS